MQLLFVDESGTPPPIDRPDTSPFFVLGGVVVPVQSWHTLKKMLDDVKGEFDVAGEIKWRFFAPHKTRVKSHSLSHLDTLQKEILRNRLFNVLVECKFIKTICVAVDTSAAYAQADINSPDQLYGYAYTCMIGGFQHYLQAISTTRPVNGLVICDHRAPNDDRRLQELHANLLADKHEVSLYKNLVEGLFIAPSHLSVGIQFADMVAGAVLRLVKNGEQCFFDHIANTLYRSSEGKIEGYGLIQIPDKKATPC